MVVESFLQKLGISHIHGLAGRKRKKTVLIVVQRHCEGRQGFLQKRHPHQVGSNQWNTPNQEYSRVKVVLCLEGLYFAELFI